MKYLLFGSLLFSGCFTGCMTMPTTINITCPMGTGAPPTVSVQNTQNKSVNANPALTAGDVQVPLK